MVQVINDFISPNQEKDILSHLKVSRIKGGFQRNTIKRYGSSLPYKAKVNPTIPDYFLPVIGSLLSLGYETDSVTVNEYLPGQSIDWHIDSPTSGPTILVLSLESLAEMGLKHPLTRELLRYPLPPRSLLILDEEHRTEWKHCIYPVTDHRFSIVFRKGTKEE